MGGPGAPTLRRTLEALGVDVEEILERLSATVTVLDADGRIRWQNALSVERVGERRGEHFADLLSPEQRELAKAEFTRILFTPGASFFREVVVLGPDATRRRSLSFSAAFGRGPRAVGVFAIGIPLNWEDEIDIAPPLSPRLLETLDLLAGGASTEQIAQRLGVTAQTARNYIRRLLAALGAHSRVEAVARARELRMLGGDWGRGS